jgi:hypothetical protein
MAFIRRHRGWAPLAVPAFALAYFGWHIGRFLT